MLEKRYKKKRNFSLIRKIKTFFYRSYRSVQIIFLLSLISLILIFFYTEKNNFINRKIVSQLTLISTKYNLVLQNVYLEGQEFTSTQDILKAIGLKIGDPIFARDVRDIRDDLEKLDWIKTAVVDREYPGNLYIGLSERVPIAIGQQNKKLFLFDIDGKYIAENNLSPFKHLPIVISEDPGIFINNLYYIISKDQKLYEKIEAIIRVSERRWNIKLIDSIEIKLPEQNIEKAWDKVIILNNRKQLFNDNILSIDLRIPNKLYVERK